MLKERISFNCTGKIGGDVKELPGFFTNHAFVGVFQYDSGTPKYALELKKRSQNFWILPKRTELLWSGTQGSRARIHSFNSVQ